MLQRLEDSVKADEPPNPSVLLAMNLAGATGSNARERLLQQIQEEVVKRAQKGREGLGGSWGGGVGWWCTPAAAPGVGGAGTAGLAPHGSPRPGWGTGVPGVLGGVCVSPQT